MVSVSVMVSEKERVADFEGDVETLSLEVRLSLAETEDEGDKDALDDWD